MDKISVYIILFHDLQFLDDIINLLNDYVDEIIIIDGPYKYACDTLKQFDLFYDTTNLPNQLQFIIHKYNKIKYEYKIFDTEEEKRIYAYNKCSNNIVLLVDCDEFFDIDITNLNLFINNNNKFVGHSNIFNMCRPYINYNEITKKYIIFKKNVISASNHLDYTWLIGCKQNTKCIEYMDIDISIGTIYHQTLNRNKFNNNIKFIFYVLLYRKQNNQPYNLLDNYDNSDILNILTKEECLHIFCHSKLASINIPNKNDTNILTVNHNNFVNNLIKYNNDIIYYYKDKMTCLKGIPVFFLLNFELYTNYINIKFNNVKNVIIELYEINLDQQYIINEYKFYDVNDNIIIKHNIINKPFIFVIKILCNTTINNNIFNIKIY